jgi:hypothetical protein
LRKCIVLAALSLVAAAVPAIGQTVSVGDLECVPLEGNSLVTASVSPPEGAANTMRLYFSRVHNEVEDFYYVEMRSAGGGNYWAVLPDPDDSTLARKLLKKENGQPKTGYEWAEWWKRKESSQDRDPNNDLDKKVIQEQASIGKQEPRAWIRSRTDGDLQRWLEAQQYEPVQYYAAAFDGQNRLVGKSEVKVAPVTKQCRVVLTPQQAGHAENLTVGETANWQRGERVFHWECDGIVTRIDPALIPRADGTCRACLIAWWKPAAIIGAGAVTGIIIDGNDPTPVSPSFP